MELVRGLCTLAQGPAVTLLETLVVPCGRWAVQGLLHLLHGLVTVRPLTWPDSLIHTILGKRMFEHGVGKFPQFQKET